jgi:hypothetical protein
MTLILVLVVVACVSLAAVLFPFYVLWRLRLWANGMIAAFPELLEVARQQRAREIAGVDNPPSDDCFVHLEPGIY